jgi:putative oxidoreductase
MIATLDGVDAMGDGMAAGLLFLRIVIGLTIFAHGYNKFFGGGRIPGTARWFDSMGMKPNGTIHAILAASTETGGGLLFAAGLITPLAAAAVVGQMVVAAWTVHRHNGFFIVKSGWEYNMVLACVAVGVAVIGPGKWSLDNVLELTFSFRSWTALALSAGVGLVASIGLLLACYRPPPPEPGSD